MKDCILGHLQKLLLARTIEEVWDLHCAAMAKFWKVFHADLERAKAELDFATSEIALRTAKAVEALHASSQRVQALSRAETSAAASLTGTEKGLKAGTRSFVDVLNARQQLLEVMQSRARANAEFILGVLNLKASSGLPDETAVEEANAFLSREAAITFPESSL